VSSSRPHTVKNDNVADPWQSRVVENQPSSRTDATHFQRREGQGDTWLKPPLGDPPLDGLNVRHIEELFTSIGRINTEVTAQRAAGFAPTDVQRRPSCVRLSHLGLTCAGAR
jgi:hypothetical protein